MTKFIGVIPARMGSSRFPGKPLAKICGMPMIEHVYRRAAMYQKWDHLILSTCDDEIREFAESINIPVIMTSNQHVRALDRVAEAMEKADFSVDKDDIVVNAQGDEPMMTPSLIEAAITPMIEDSSALGTVLALPIIDEAQFYDPNTLKIVHNLKGDILYTSRSPVPYCKKFTPKLGVHRIYGIFGFRWHFLQKFTSLAESPLELNESCDSNRLYDHGLTQRIAKHPYMDSFAVDSPEDLEKVEMYMSNDTLYSKYEMTKVVGDK